MAANIDVVKESRKLGIHPSMSFSYQASFHGTRQMYETINHVVNEIRLDQFRKDSDSLSAINPEQ